MKTKFEQKEEALLEDLRGYENRWVAIFESEDEERIVGSGADAVQAIKDAEANGFKDTVLFYVGSFDSGFIPRT